MNNVERACGNCYIVKVSWMAVVRDLWQCGTLIDIPSQQIG